VSEQPPCAPAPAKEGRDGIALRRILWACDFSFLSDSALRVVVPLARAFGAEVTALHVIPTTVPPGAGVPYPTNPAVPRAQLHHDVYAALERHADPARHASVPTHTALREGKPVDQILELAARLPADLIAVGTRGYGALERGLLGTVVESLLGRAACPVLAVPMLRHAPAGLPFKTVLWATDFSAHATLAERYAVSIAGRDRARLLLLHVVEGDPLDADRAQRKQAMRRLEETASDGTRAGCVTEAIVTTTSEVAHEVLRVAEERDADLVVMGVQGWRALHSIFYGSTAKRVIRDAHCAVLAVRRT
jgi:nucleotide-binding universal stress UspA family protein